MWINLVVFFIPCFSFTHFIGWKCLPVSVSLIYSQILYINFISEVWPDKTWTDIFWSRMIDCLYIVLSTTQSCSSLENTFTIEWIKPFCSISVVLYSKVFSVQNTPVPATEKVADTMTPISFMRNCCWDAIAFLFLTRYSKTHL